MRSQSRCNVLSLNSLLKLDAPELDFSRLCLELEKPDSIKNKDIYTPYSRGEQNKRFLRLARATLSLNVKAAKEALRRPFRLR